MTLHFYLCNAGGPDQSGTLSIQSTALIQPSDASASGFYTANPNNVFLNNAASGGWAGYAFPTLPAPIGVSIGAGATGCIVEGLHMCLTLNHSCCLQVFANRTDIVPLQRPLGLFDGNTAHSTGNCKPQLALQGRHSRC
jgi:hypothetical protein